MSNALTLSLSSDTLNAFKADFDAVLRETVRKMIENNETEGTVTAKMTITLEDRADSRGECYCSPTLVHKVSSVVQAKASQGGAFLRRLRPGMGPPHRPVRTAPRKGGPDLAV